MKYLEVQAIVLRRNKFNTQDCYLTLFTRQLGRIEVFAGGANSPKSPLNKGASPFVFGNFSLSGRGKYRLQSVEVIDGFYHLREDMETFLAATLIARSLLAMSAEGEVNISLYELSVNTIAIFHKYPKLIPAATIYFFYRAARALGIEPAPPQCMECRQSGYVFSAEEGGFFCDTHASGGRRFTQDELSLFQELSAKPLVAFLNTSPAEEAVRGVREALEMYWLAQWQLNVKGLQKELSEYL